MRFGLFIPQGWRFDLTGVDPSAQWATMRDLAQYADGVPGWESLWVYDHFHTTPQPSDQATHESWSLMAGLAASTQRIRLGQMCTCMAYRNPAYLAKVAATVDHISGGRIEMGIGAGWYEHEWRAYGYGFPAARDRLGMLREGVEIFRQAWTTGTATLDGRYYQVDGAIVQPQPLQTGRSGIPIWVAGSGEKVTLKIAAKYADYTNFNGDASEFKRLSDVLAGHCEAIGRDVTEITRSRNFNVFIGQTHAEADAKIAAAADRYEPHLGRAGAEEYAARTSTGALIGTPAEIVDQVAAFAEAGLAYAITYFAEAAYDRSGIELFEREVLPALA